MSIPHFEPVIGKRAGEIEGGSAGLDFLIAIGRAQDRTRNSGGKQQCCRVTG
jgi:hypothetical protein